MDPNNLANNLQQQFTIRKVALDPTHGRLAPSLNAKVG